MTQKDEALHRTHRCGDLRAAHAGEEVTLAGWVNRRRDHGGLTFIDLRDRGGVVQVVFHPESAPEAHKAARDLRSEFVIRVQGRVVDRSAENINPNLPTGEVEVSVAALEVLNPCDPLPVSLDDLEASSEEMRLRWRYLDLRRPAMQQNLALRHRITMAVRKYLDEQEFLELETPILTKSTPEGARDYLVPSRLYHGQFFALPQSPQIFKQIFMISGFDRYFQIARCFRDEDLRADRQPEFTQIDMEMSFVTPEEIYRIVEKMMARVFAAADRSWPESIPRMAYDEAMDRYGSDRPDLRYDLPITDVTEEVSGSSFQLFAKAAAAGQVVRGLAVPGGGACARREFDELTELAKQHGAKGLVWIKLGDGGISSPVLKHLGEDLCSRIASRLGAAAGDAVLLVADERLTAAPVLGALRQEVARRRDLIDAGKTSILWVQDFPLFEYDARGGRWTSIHHPFTSPYPEDLPLIESDPGAVRSLAYDLVMNGSELGGGSIRIHRVDVQRRIFARLGLSEQEVEAKFGFFLGALGHGAPPHGGIALGLDRVVAILAGASSLREVIAFPKTTSSMDLMTGSPSEVSAAQLEELGIRLAAPVAKPEEQ